MRSKIKGLLGSYLESRGFKETDEQWTWIRPRTPWVSDHIVFSLLSKSAPDLYGVSLRVGVQSLPVNHLLAILSGGRYRLTHPLVSPLLSDPSISSRKIPSRWDFWSTAFDVEEAEDMLWHLDRFGMPFMEAFNTLDDLVNGLTKYAQLFQLWPEKAAAVLALADRFDDAHQHLELGRRTIKGLSEEQHQLIGSMMNAFDDQSIRMLVAKARVGAISEA